MNNISFVQLKPNHFPLLLKWLEASHIKRWWDQDVSYTLDLVKNKYENCTQGFKKVGSIDKPINAYIIFINKQPIGYIQLYSTHDFLSDEILSKLPKNLGAFDIFIGETEHLGKRWGSIIVRKFLNIHAETFDHIFVNPDAENLPAIKTYEKAYFKKIGEHDNKIWMMI